MKCFDLCYEEDSNCQTDLNVVMTQAGEFIEIQGTAEDKPFTRAQSNAMLEMAEKGIAELIKSNKKLQAGNFKLSKKRIFGCVFYAFIKST